MQHNYSLPFLRACRQVRCVPQTWQHQVYNEQPAPMHKHLSSSPPLPIYKPLTEEQAAEFYKGPPNSYQMYETLSQGTPISPAFQTAEELLDWLIENRASFIGKWQGSREDWKQIIEQSARNR